MTLECVFANRLPHQEEAVQDAFKQLEEASHLQEAGLGLRGTSATLISIGGITQQCTSNPEGL